MATVEKFATLFSFIVIGPLIEKQILYTRQFWCFCV